MQEQTTTINNSKHRKRPQQQNLLRHSHQALSASNPNPKRLPHLPSSLKVILKVPHSSPSPSPSPSSSLSRPSPPPSSDLPRRRHLSPAPPSPFPSPSPSPSVSLSPSPSPSPSSSPTAAFPPPSRAHLSQRLKLTSELQHNHDLHQQHQRPSKPPLQQIKPPPLDSKQHPPKKSSQLSSQLQHRAHHASPHPRLERANPNGQYAPPDLKNQHEEYINPPSKLAHTQRLVKPGDEKCAEQIDPTISRRFKRLEEHEEDESASRARWVESAYVIEKLPDTCRIKHSQTVQADLVNPSRIRQTEQADTSNPSCLGRREHGQEAYPSRFRRGELVDQAVADRTQPEDELERGYKRAEEADNHHSRSKRLEVQQLDEGAILKRPQRHPQEQEERHNHTAPIPKRLRSSHQQGQQEQGRSQLGSLKVTPHNKHTQISSEQLPLKKLTQSSVQGPHGLHQSSKLSSQTSSPHPVPPSTPASMQSSAPSLSTSAVSDEAHKPSKKRKLQSLLELESTDGQSVAADGAQGQPQVLPAIPAATSAAVLPPVQLSMQIDDSRDCTTANSSPKRAVQDPQLIPARKLLNNILDRLQKKDKFGVFAEPVDPKEVPNYYDIIKDPMDFGTMRGRISSGHYNSIELFQKDVFLICDNAMQYNGKGTVYFRHARSIKDIAERILEDLKVSGLSVELDEPITKFRNGGIGRSNEKHDSCMNTGSPSDARLDNLDEFPGYFLRTSGSMDGRRFQVIDENRRSTYLSTCTSLPVNDSLLTTISGDSSHLVPTGYQMDFLYSKSLARFAADLGPLVWKIAAEKIRKALPPGCPFGPGWVGERETGGVALAPKTKQQMVMQSTTHQTAKLLCENGAVATSDTGLTSASQSKNETLRHTHVGGYLQDDPEPETKVESKSGVQDSAKPPLEMRSPMVFGNSLAQIDRPERFDQQVLGQPAAQPMMRLHNSDNSRPLGEARCQADKDCLVKLDRTSGILGNKSKFAGQVNLNHPVSVHPDEGTIVDNGFSNQVGIPNSRDVEEGKLLPGSGPSGGVIPIPRIGGLGFNLGGAFSPTPPQTDGVNSVKAVSIEMGMNTAARKQFDGKGIGFSRLNTSNDIPCTEAGSITTSDGKNDVMYQPNNFQISCGPPKPHNINMSVQQPCGISDMDTRDGSAFDPMRLASSLSHSAQGFTLQRNAITLVQQTGGSNQHSSSSHHVGTRDVSTVDQGLSIPPDPPCTEQALGERFKETGDLIREKEMLSLAGRMATGGSSTMPRQGLTSERGFTMQPLEPRNGHTSSLDLASATIHNLDHLNRKQNAGGGFPGLPTPNGVPVVREMPGWKPAQQPDSISVTGKGGIVFQNQVLKSPAEQPEVNKGGGPFMRLHTSGVQDPQIYGYGPSKLVSSMPHFLQQQLGGDNIHGLPSQHQQAKLHVQGGSLLAGAQNLNSSDSREANFVRQFQLPSHRGFAQAGSPAWQYMPQPMTAQGSHQAFAVAPDLNVSLPLTKSPFDQSNGNDIQQPDLALQL